ncbi:methylated-DNA--[protein]-cysteine S-methyltransferase [Campylobacter sp. faydin G-140]|nr:methylated-DNA--[protein]-cysteine S-methyltransferase [Campylobacter anatolicus]
MCNYLNAIKFIDFLSLFLYHLLKNKGENVLYTSTYSSPLGEILLTSDNIGLTGLWINDNKFYTQNSTNEYRSKQTQEIVSAKRWLDVYFDGKVPSFTPPLHMTGSDFSLSVWQILLSIPYGKTTTYGEIARQIAKNRGISKMSAQAVGGAVGRNSIAIIIPCHRVIGTDGTLVGYTGGLDIKKRLLKLENSDKI